jgi:hypothetical protein
VKRRKFVFSKIRAERRLLVEGDLLVEVHPSGEVRVAVGTGMTARELIIQVAQMLDGLLQHFQQDMHAHAGELGVTVPVKSAPQRLCYWLAHWVERRIMGRPVWPRVWVLAWLRDGWPMRLIHIHIDSTELEHLSGVWWQFGR